MLGFLTTTNYTSTIFPVIKGLIRPLVNGRGECEGSNC